MFFECDTFLIVFNLDVRIHSQKHSAPYKYGRGKGKVEHCYNQNGSLPFLIFYFFNGKYYMEIKKYLLSPHNNNNDNNNSNNKNS